MLDADAGEAPAGEKGRERAIEIEASFELGVVHVVEQLWARLGIGQAIAARWQLTTGEHFMRRHCWP